MTLDEKKAFQDECDLAAICMVGALMRDAQKKFFKTRDPKALADSKKYVKEFDDLLSQIVIDRESRYAEEVAQ